MTQTNENPALPLEANSSATPEITTKSTTLTSEGSAAWFGAENTSGAPASNSSETFVSQLHVAPLPRAENLTWSTRKKGKSNILSSSPFKRQLEEDNTSKNKKTSIKPKKTFKKPQTTPKKKIWKCPGSHEVYTEPISEDWIEFRSAKHDGMKNVLTTLTLGNIFATCVANKQCVLLSTHLRILIHRSVQECANNFFMFY